MKEFVLSEFIAIFEQIFGKWLWWGMVIVAIAITLLFIYNVVKQRHFSPKNFIWALVAAPFGGIVAIFFILWITDTKLSNITTPIDAIVLLGVFGLGAVGTIIWVYVLGYYIKDKKAIQ